MIVFDQIGSKGRMGNILFEIASTMGIAAKIGTDYAFNTDYVQGFDMKLPVAARRGPVYEEYPNMDYSEGVYHMGKNFTLDGYFQSEKYFEHIKEKILKTFVFSPNIESQINKKYQLALRLDPVSFHVRRTDYVTQGWYAGDRWYLDRMAELEGKLVLVFSDDINYCMEMFSDFGNIAYIHEEETNSLCLMSKCRRHVISNSTFSWWGAYLSQSEDVVYPSSSYPINNGAGAFPNKDFYPEMWTNK